MRLGVTPLGLGLRRNGEMRVGLTPPGFRPTPERRNAGGPHPPWVPAYAGTTKCGWVSPPGSGLRRNDEMRVGLSRLGSGLRRNDGARGWVSAAWVPAYAGTTEDAPGPHPPWVPACAETAEQLMAVSE